MPRGHCTVMVEPTPCCSRKEEGITASSSKQDTSEGVFAVVTVMVEPRRCCRAQQGSAERRMISKQAGDVGNFSLWCRLFSTKTGNCRRQQQSITTRLSTAAPLNTRLDEHHSHHSHACRATQCLTFAMIWRAVPGSPLMRSLTMAVALQPALQTLPPTRTQQKTASVCRACLTLCDHSASLEHTHSQRCNVCRASPLR
jgi:hypothetical protein